MSIDTADRDLLVLGLLRMHEMHGYALVDAVAAHFGGGPEPKRATLYDALRRMNERGLIVAREEREGNRPPRQVFAITPGGEETFQELLRRDVATFRPLPLQGEIGLAFLDVLPRKEAAELLRRRFESAAETLGQAVAAGGHPGSMSAALDHRRVHLETEVEWLKGLVARLEAGCDEERSQ